MKERPYYIKLQNAVRKIKLIKIYNDIGIIEKSPYLEFRETLFFQCIDTILTLYTIFIPIIVESLENPREMFDNIFLTEVIALLFMIDQYLVYKLSSTFPIDFHRFMELTSNIGMMVFIHILYIQPVDIKSMNIFIDNQFYSLWIISCLLKVFRLN